MSNQSEFVCLNGKIVQLEQAVIPAANSALYYGTGCFETLLAEASVFFKLKDHIERLNSGMDYLSGGKVDPVSAEQIKNDTLQLLKKNRLENVRAKVRIQFSFLEESGYSPDQNFKTFLLITVSDAAESDNSWTLKTADTRVVPGKSRPVDLKLSNMLHYRQAWREAKMVGSDDAILLTYDNYIAETAIGNLFWKNGDVIYTPSAECDILPGIMRNSLIDILNKRSSFKVVEGKYLLDDIKSAESVWMTNSVREIQEISEIDGMQFTHNQPFFSQLNEWYSEYKREYSS